MRSLAHSQKKCRVYVMKCRIIDYLSRIGKSRGFGIQSPWAYSFVTDVIMERLPYYAYELIDRQYSTKQERKREKLLLRLRNYCRTGTVLTIDIATISQEDISTLPKHLKEGSILVIDNICQSDETYRKWILLRDNENIGITFDLRHMALCFPHDNKYKQHYKLNF